MKVTHLVNGAVVLLGKGDDDTMETENVWQKQDKIISYLVREKNMNLAVDAGTVRDDILKLMEENLRLRKVIQNKKL